MAIKFGENCLYLSFANLNKIKHAYHDALSIGIVDHLSINLVNPEGEILFFSSTPETGYNVCSGDLWKYDYSIHPSMYRRHRWFSWDDCYDDRKKHELTFHKEVQNSLKFGFVVSKPVEDFHLLYSFASKKPINHANVRDYIDLFEKAGDTCYKNIYPLCKRYSGIWTPPLL